MTNHHQNNYNIYKNNGIENKWSTLNEFDAWDTNK